MEKKPIGCIIQARMRSSRFPKKVMREIYDHKTVLDCVIDQLSYSKLIDNLVVATSQDKIDGVKPKSISRWTNLRLDNRLILILGMIYE